MLLFGPRRQQCGASEPMVRASHLQVVDDSDHVCVYGAIRELEVHVAHWALAVVHLLGLEALLAVRVTARQGWRLHDHHQAHAAAKLRNGRAVDEPVGIQFQLDAHAAVKVAGDDRPTSLAMSNCPEGAGAATDTAGWEDAAEVADGCGSDDAAAGAAAAVACALAADSCVARLRASASSLSHRLLLEVSCACVALSSSTVSSSCCCTVAMRRAEEASGGGTEPLEEEEEEEEAAADGAARALGVAGEGSDARAPAPAATVAVEVLLHAVGACAWAAALLVCPFVCAAEGGDGGLRDRMPSRPGDTRTLSLPAIEEAAGSQSGSLWLSLLLAADAAAR